MADLLKIVLVDGRLILIRESQVCSVTLGEKGAAILRMSNGDELICVNPPYMSWENDSLVR